MKCQCDSETYEISKLLVERLIRTFTNMHFPSNCHKEDKITANSLTFFTFINCKFLTSSFNIVTVCLIFPVKRIYLVLWNIIVILKKNMQNNPQEGIQVLLSIFTVNFLWMSILFLAWYTRWLSFLVFPDSTSCLGLVPVEDVERPDFCQDRRQVCSSNSKDISLGQNPEKHLNSLPLHVPLETLPSTS